MNHEGIQESRKEPDLFFPSSDSEEEEVLHINPTTSTIDGRSSSSSTTIKGIGIHSSPIRNSSTLSNGETKPLISSQGSSDIIPLDASCFQPTSSSAGPSRHRRPSPLSHSSSSNVPLSFTSGYLGEFVCEGWSLSKGKGYCVPGSKVVFERPKIVKGSDEDAKIISRSKDKVGPAKLVNGKVVNAKSKPVGGKQVTLGSLGMGKKAASLARLPRCV